MRISSALHQRLIVVALTALASATDTSAQQIAGNFPGGCAEPQSIDILAPRLGTY
jgi:hypothetical protein